MIRKPVPFVMALLLLANSGLASNQPSLFSRIDEAANGIPLALQVASISYENPGAHADLRVTLISAVHVGDKAYYQQLNEMFTSFDVVLYELVAPQGTRVDPNAKRRGGFISGTQNLMSEALDLAHQLKEVDYSPENFVHADLSPSEFKQSMKEREESLYVYFWRAFYASMNQYARDPLGLQGLQSLGDAMRVDGGNALKIKLARDMASMETMREVFGVDSQNAIIGARNQRAMQELAKQIAAGKREIAIFYGAAHMPDFEERLFEQYQLVPVNTEWLDAWDLAPGVKRVP